MTLVTLRSEGKSGSSLKHMSLTFERQVKVGVTVKTRHFTFGRQVGVTVETHVTYVRETSKSWGHRYVTSLYVRRTMRPNKSGRHKRERQSFYQQARHAVQF